MMPASVNALANALLRDSSDTLIGECQPSFTCLFILTKNGQLPTPLLYPQIIEIVINKYISSENCVKDAFSAYISVNGVLNSVKRWIYGVSGIYRCSLFTASAPLWQKKCKGD